MKINYAHRRMMRYNVKSKLVKKAIAQLDPFTRAMAHSVFFMRPVLKYFAEVIANHLIAMHDVAMQAKDLIIDCLEEHR